MGKFHPPFQATLMKNKGWEEELATGLPPLGVVSVQSLLGEVLVPAAGLDVLAGLQTYSVGILPQIGDIMRSVTAL